MAFTHSALSACRHSRPGSQAFWLPSVLYRRSQNLRSIVFAFAAFSGTNSLMMRLLASLIHRRSGCLGACSTGAGSRALPRVPPPVPRWPSRPLAWPPRAWRAYFAIEASLFARCGSMSRSIRTRTHLRNELRNVTRNEIIAAKPAPSSMIMYSPSFIGAPMAGYPANLCSQKWNVSHRTRTIHTPNVRKSAAVHCERRSLSVMRR